MRRGPGAAAPQHTTLSRVHRHPRRPPATAAVRPGWFRVCGVDKKKSAATHGQRGGSASLGEGPGDTPGWTQSRWSARRGPGERPRMDVVTVVTQGGARG